MRRSRRLGRKKASVGDWKEGGINLQKGGGVGRGSVVSSFAGCWGDMRLPGVASPGDQRIEAAFAAFYGGGRLRDRYPAVDANALVDLLCAPDEPHRYSHGKEPLHNIWVMSDGTQNSSVFGWTGTLWAVGAEMGHEISEETEIRDALQAYSLGSCNLSYQISES